MYAVAKCLLVQAQQPLGSSLLKKSGADIICLLPVKKTVCQITLKHTLLFFGRKLSLVHLKEVDSGLKELKGMVGTVFKQVGKA